MELKTSVSYPWIASKAVDGPTWPAIFPRRIGTRSRAGLVPRAVAIIAACLIEAIMILGFVGASLGLGYESYSGVGPDRPPPPATPAPRSATGTTARLALTLVAHSVSMPVAGGST